MDQPARQSLVVLLCDQLQKNCMSPYGGPVEMPTFDRLAGEGIAFDRYYCATPLCIPTRPSMMNGRWPHQHGARSFGEGYDTIEQGSELLIDRLHDDGFHVAYDGVWHIRRPEEDDRRDEYEHFEEGGFPYNQHGEALVEEGIDEEAHRAPIHGMTDEGMIPGNISVPVPATWTEPLKSHPDMQKAQRIAQFILDAPEDEPIAAWCSLGSPHPPLLVPEPYRSMFDPEEIEPPPGFDCDLSGRPHDVREAPGALGCVGWEWERWAEAIAAYYGYVAFADHCHGIVMGALEESGRLDDTIVVASCDHGEMLGAHGIYQKMVMYERSINIPFIMRIPGYEPGRREHMTSQTDLAPTILDLLGMPGLDDAAGESMVPILRDHNAPWRTHTFSEYNGWIRGGWKMRAVIGQRYKYIYHHEDHDELFDLKKDPDELTNILGQSRRLDVADELRSRLVSFSWDTDDFMMPSWPHLDIDYGPRSAE
jgi:arylsulfatase A-like enzyme